MEVAVTTRCEVRCGDGADRCEASGASLAGPGPDHRHDASHAHDHSHDRTGDRRRIVAALAVSAVIFAAEVAGGLISGSLALLSDAGHVLADMSALIISLVALLLASRPASRRRSFGFYRLEILAALANGIILVALAGGIIIAAVRRLGDAAPAAVQTDIMLPVAIVGLVANLAGAWLLHGAKSLNVRGAYLHVVSDALASVAVVAGGLVIRYYPGLTFVDPVLGIVIAAVVVVGAFRLLREATNVLLEAAPASIDPERVRNDVEQLPGVTNVHDLHIWTITSGLNALSAHIVVEDGTGSDDVLCRVKALLAKDHHIGHSTLQLESKTYERHAH
jgi:cobalt-zinc-cadmium efflux system protein